MLLERHLEADTNGDGTLSHEEARAFMGDHHGAAGAHGAKGRHHGMMGHVGMMIKHLEKLDTQSAPADFNLERHPGAETDGDGQVSHDEWIAFSEEARPRLLARLLSVAPEADTDGDGALSEAELEAFRANRAGEHRARVLQGHPQADTDGDGTLSQEEARAFMGSREGDSHGWDCPAHPGGGCPFAEGKGHHKGHDSDNGS